MAAFHISREPFLPNFRDGTVPHVVHVFVLQMSLHPYQNPYFFMDSDGNFERKLLFLFLGHIYRIFIRKSLVARRQKGAEKLLTFRLMFPWYGSTPEVAVDQKIETAPLRSKIIKKIYPSLMLRKLTVRLR